MTYVIETVYWVATGTVAGAVLGQLVRAAVPVLRRRR